MHAVLIMAAALAMTNQLDNRWELPCASPLELLSQGDERIGPNWSDSTEEITTTSHLAMRGRNRRAVSVGHSRYAPAKEAPESAARGRLMHWFGLSDVESDPRLGVGLRFEKARNFTLHLKLVDRKPAIGVGYYTRYRGRVALG
jgi:hypothetical protein